MPLGDNRTPASPHQRQTQSSKGAVQACALCTREVPAALITLHHLLPKQQGGKAEHRQPLCKPCHKQIHAVFSNKQLAASFHTIEQLRAAPELASFLAWIRRQKPNRNFRTATSADQPKRRSR